RLHAVEARMHVGTRAGDQHAVDLGEKAVEVDLAAKCRNLHRQHARYPDRRSQILLRRGMPAVIVQFFDVGRQRHKWGKHHVCPRVVVPRVYRCIGQLSNINSRHSTLLVAYGGTEIWTPALAHVLIGSSRGRRASPFVFSMTQPFRTYWGGNPWIAVHS